VAVEYRLCVLTKKEPRPVTVDCRLLLEIYPRVPRPATVDWNAGEIVLERRFIAEESVLKDCVRDDTDVLYKVEIELCVLPTRVENVENPSLITAVEISVV
jgi:hypothetical protein